MRRLALVALLITAFTLPPAAQAAPRPAGYDLPASGILLEGIGVDDARRCDGRHGDHGRCGGRNTVFYVSGVNDGGNVYRGRVGREQLELWYDGTGTTGRGIDVDRHGRVYVAGGPTGTVRVFDRTGTLLATVADGAPGSFLNDLWVGPDGSVYVTDSSLPKIWRLTSSGSGWTLTEWLDVSPTITYTPATTDFDLGGIVTTPDRRFLLTSQGTTGQLWRIDLATRHIREVDLGGASVVNADGIVLRGHKLWVVQNFSRQVSQLRLRDEWRSARVVRVQTTPADKTLTTAKLFGGRLLAVDSQFGFPPETAPAEDRVVALQPSAGVSP
jgi:Cu-Zn family superoxide dismutase